MRRVDPSAATQAVSLCVLTTQQLPEQQQRAVEEVGAGERSRNCARTCLTFIETYYALELATEEGSYDVLFKPRVFNECKPKEKILWHF